MLIVFTGNGKGKTTSALGVALRSLGWNKNVAIIQFIKGNKSTGEWKIINEVNSPQLQIFQFFDDDKLSITEKEITGLRTEEYKKACADAWSFTKELLKKGEHNLIVLDEINNALHYGLLDDKEVIETLDALSDDPNLDIICSGRDAPQSLIDIADMVTEMKEIKHPFQKGISAKKGIDY